MTPVTLPHLAVARVSGADAGSFLQAQLSADVAVLADGGATFACYCSPRGQVFGLLLVCRVGEEFRLVADSRLLPVMVQRLGLFVLRARVVLAKVDGLVVQGLWPGHDTPAADRVFKPFGMELSYRLVAGTAESTGDEAGWKEQELRQNVAWLGPATSERFIPQMLGFDRIGAVSFSKGCYPGQEVIARARYLGKVKRQPLLLHLFENPQPVPGEPLQLMQNEQQLDGTVVDSVTSVTGPGHKAVLVFAVAPVPTGALQAVRYAGIDYRCATI